MGLVNRISKWLGFLALASLVLFGCSTNEAYREPNSAPPAGIQNSYDGVAELDSYGQWYDLPPYGNVWRPNVGPDWRPFYYGQWDYTPPDWTWVSYEPFGWIVYHYGSWLDSGVYGWVWVPGGGPWSPATVVWSSYDDYVCWAPRPPRDVILPSPWERDQRGVDVWSVVHARDFTDENVGRERLESSFVRPREQHAQIVHRVPDPRSIERYSGRQVQSVTIPRQPVKVGKQQLHRMQPPPADRERADRHRPEVEKQVTKNAGNQRNTGSQRNTGNHR